MHSKMKLYRSILQLIQTIISLAYNYILNYDLDDCSNFVNAPYYEPIPFYSPAYPYDYFNDLDCFWFIYAPNKVDCIQLDFIDFNLEDGYDFLTVSCQNILFKLVTVSKTFLK